MRKLISVLLSVVLVLVLAVPAIAEGTASQKEEVVYGILSLDGGVQNIYVVNSFKGGVITDYGDYRAVSNMTSSEKLMQSGDMITINSKAQQFYYQGTLVTKDLPWSIAIQYKLDGREISPSELAGKDGALLINLSIMQNQAANPVFYENYTLQLSLALDTEKCTEISSPNATLANAGKNKVIAHTVLPGNDANITVSALVRDFAMGGIEITAVPLLMLIELPEADDLTAELVSLSDAVSALNDGMKELSEGIAKSHSGARSLTDGSSDFADGLSALSGNSDSLLKASTQINEALADITKALDDGSGIDDLTDLAALPGGLMQLVGGLTGIAAAMTALKNGYASAYTALDSAITDIPDTDIDPSALYAAVNGSDELTASLDQLMGYYGAAKTVQFTYGAVKEAFASVEAGLDTISGSIGEIAATLSGLAHDVEQAFSSMGIAEQMQQLQDGLSMLSHNYSQFHAGLDEYVNGAEKLARGYAEVHAGMESLTSGLGKLDAGSSELSDGTNELNNAVVDLPELAQKEIDQLANQYDHSDFIPVSFVSPKNTSVIAVQFIMKTASIDAVKALPPSEEEPVNLTFWQKFLKLLGLYP